MGIFPIEMAIDLHSPLQLSHGYREEPVTNWTSRGMGNDGDQWSLRVIPAKEECPARGIDRQHLGHPKPQKMAWFHHVSPNHIVFT